MKEIVISITDGEPKRFDYSFAREADKIVILDSNVAENV
jgi:hypothetical protein